MSHQLRFKPLIKKMTQLQNKSLAQAFHNYWNHALHPGDFAMAVLSNDLYLAAARSDNWNRDSLYSIAIWVQDNAPIGSYGSVELVKGWLERNHFFEEYQKRLVVSILKDSGQSVKS